MAQSILSNDIPIPFFPGELVWSGYVLPGAAPINLTLPVGLYALQSRGDQANQISRIVLPNSYGNTVSFSGTNIYVRTEETSFRIIPSMRNVNFSQYTPSTFSLTAFIHDGTNYAFVGNYGAPPKLAYTYSTDLITWSTRSISNSTTLSLFARSNSDALIFVYDSTGPSAKYFLAVNDSAATNHIFYSTDSVTWTGATLPGTIANNTNRSIAVNPNATNRYVTTVSSSTTNTQICTSTNGITWTSRTFLGSGYNPDKVVTNGTTSTNQIYVVHTGNETAAVATSTDGVTWTSRVTVTGTGDVLWFANKYWLISNSVTSSDSSYSNSTDGVTWTTGIFTSSATPGSASSVVMLGTELFTGATGNTNYTSTDGITWEGYGSGNGSTLRYVNNKLFISSSFNHYINDGGSYVSLYRLDNQVVSA